jgi:hypothetical protein
MSKFLCVIPWLWLVSGLLFPLSTKLSTCCETSYQGTHLLATRRRLMERDGGRTMASLRIRILNFMKLSPRSAFMILISR